jgi:hypothetical protein
MEFAQGQVGQVNEFETDITQITRKIEKGYHRTRKNQKLLSGEPLIEPTPNGLRRKRRRQGPLKVRDRLDIAHKVLVQDIPQVDVAQEYGVSQGVVGQIMLKIRR